MTNYLEEYSKAVQTLEAFKKSIMSGVVNLIKTIALKPIEIGNYVYYYIKNDDGEDVPAFLPTFAYDGKNTDNFVPIYNDGTKFNGSNAYGVARFEDACEHFDKIRKMFENR